MSNSAQKACITIDLDSIGQYYRIFGLEQPGSDFDNIIYNVGLKRFVDLLDRFGFSATLFVVSGDLRYETNADELRKLAANGHEIASHTCNHDYRLTRADDTTIRRDLVESKRELENACQTEVVGFRAPGYNVHERLLKFVEKAGYRYDSSVFPCTPYYATKAAALSAFSLMGRPSKSILCGPQVLAAPLGPYRMNPERYWKKGNGLWEIPITVSPILRFPLLGSFILLSAKRFWPILWRMTKASSRLLNFEFHGIDFLDGECDGIDPELIRRQVDLRIPWNVKEELFSTIFTQVGDECDVRPLHEALTRLENEYE